MGLLDFFKKKEKKPESEVILDPQEAQLKRIKSINATLRMQRVKAQEEIELKRLQLAQAKQELEEKIELKKLQRELEDLEDEDDDDDDDEEDEDGDLVSKFLSALMTRQANAGGQISHQSPQTINPHGQTPPAYTYEQMLEKWNSLNPIARAQARTMSDDQIRDFLISQDPTISAQNIAQVVQIVRTQQ